MNLQQRLAYRKRFGYKDVFSFSGTNMSRSRTLSSQCFAVLLVAASALLTGPVGAASAEPPTVSFTASGHAVAANDMARSSAYAEVTGSQPREVAAKVNAQIAAALELARQYPSIRTKSGTTNTWPVYAKDSRTISNWRMRSSLVLESEDIPALSELIGKLQDTLAVESLTLMPAPATQAKAEDVATANAIAAFRARARLVADALDAQFRIKQLDIGGHNVGMPVAARGMAVQMASAPVQAGDSDITIQVNGTIELID